MKYITKETDGTVERVTVELNGARYRRLSDANSFKWQRQRGSDWIGITQVADELERRYWLMGTPPTLIKTVRVRIAVAVDYCGGWAAHGGESVSEDYSQGNVLERTGNLGSRQLFWLTAELPIPVPSTQTAATVETL